MTTRHDTDFRSEAGKYISGPQAKGLCEFMAHTAFLKEHEQREATDGRRVVAAFIKHVEKTVELVRQMREEANRRDAEQEASELAGSSG